MRRLLEIDKTTIGGSPTLTPVRFVGSEGLSQLYAYRLTAMCETAGISPKDALGKSVTVSIAADEEGSPRIVNGLIVGMKALGRRIAPDEYAFEFEIAPALWLLSLNTDCRIFQNKTPADIIKEVLKPYARDVAAEFKIQKATAKREYCVQYNETDLDFIMRLASEEGVFFNVRYKDGGAPNFDQVVEFADHTGAYVKCADAQVDFHPDAEMVGGIHAWSAADRLHTSEWRLSDYNEIDSETDLETKASARDKDRAASDSKRYLYHGRYQERSGGERLAGVRMDQEEIEERLYEGAGLYMHFAPGETFSFAEKPPGMDVESSVLIAVDHDAIDYSGYQEIQSDAPGRDLLMTVEDAVVRFSRYRNVFRCIPSKQVFRPPPPDRPRAMPGLQRALVVGDEEDVNKDFTTDKHARVHVKFLWDRSGTKGSTASCWLRVAQSWAGPGYGAIFIPRAGMEVLVDFIEGDPDRPIVVGSVYNDVNTPPFDLPDARKISGFRTQSIGSSTKIFNELKFVDESDKELVFISAGKDFTRYVKNDDELKVDNKQSRTIKADRTVKISEGNDALAITKGDQSVKLDAGQSTLEAAKKIEFKVGQSTITLTPDGVTIKATKISIEGQMSAEMKAVQVSVKGSAQTKVSSPMTEVSGDGMLTLKGGLTKIN